MKHFAALLIFAAAGNAQAQVYKCEVDGVTTFSQVPCAVDAEAIEIKHSQIPAKVDGNEDIAEKCLEYIRRSKNWKDRESVRLEGSYKTWVKDYSGSRHVLIMLINSKNSYGGYGGAESYECFLNHEGNDLSKVQHRVRPPR